MNPIITLSPWEYERAFAVGVGRFTANWGTADAPYYDRRRMEEDRNAQPAAAICELAVAKYTNQYWHGGVWHRTDHGRYKSLADVGSVIEVRRVRTANAVKVRSKDKGKIVWAARLADDEYRSVELLGFISADVVIASLVGTYQDEKYVELDTLTPASDWPQLSEGTPREIPSSASSA
jgi:hypothetical protein